MGAARPRRGAAGEESKRHANTRRATHCRDANRVALTGTPVENRLSELWSIMHILNPGLLGTNRSFRDRFAIPIEREHDAEATERLRRITAPFLLRRLKSDRTIIDDLPDKIETTEHCPLTREQATLYQAVVDEVLEQSAAAEGIGRRGLVLAGIMRLKQVCNHPAQFLRDGSALAGRSGKLTRADELLDEIVAAGDKALCFTQFAEWGGLLAPYWRRRFGVDVGWLHGGVTRQKRDGLVARLPERSRPRSLADLAQGGRRRPEPHGRDPRRAPRPLVEPRSRRSGDGSCVPDRTTASGAGAQAREHGHRRRAHRRDDRLETRAGREGGRERRSLDHRALDRRPSRVIALSAAGRGRLMAPTARNDRWNRFPESVPRRVDGGLVTSKQRGSMAGTWWSQRFVAVLESYGLGGRMGRGRRYARTGQVVSLDVRPGLFVAQVQGSRRTPYTVTIAMRKPTAKQWIAIDEAMLTRIGFVAELLAGEVPAALEAVFRSAGTTLLPTAWAQLTARCSCPDPANPCKHVAAVLYVFADQLDADPWLLLAWRGRTRDQVLTPLRAPRAGRVAPARLRSSPPGGRSGPHRQPQSTHCEAPTARFQRRRPPTQPTPSCSGARRSTSRSTARTPPTCSAPHTHS